MNQQSMPNITLFDLLGRSWQRRAAVGAVAFNSDDTLLAIAAADGTVALARLADNEPPEARIVVDNGQVTIRPREGRPAPLITTRIEASRGISAFGDGEFLVHTGGGELLRIDRAGEIAAKVLADQTPVGAFDHCRNAGFTAVLVQGRLRLLAGGTGAVTEAGPTAEAGAPAATILSIAGDGQMVALAGTGAPGSPGRLVVRRTAGACEPVCSMPLSARPLALRWSDDGRWLACGMETGGLGLLRVDTGEHVTLGDFPGPVGALDWSPAAHAFFASGAYRIAGWSMHAPPLAGSASGALATGQAGFVLVSSIAAHPLKGLVAAGHGNGRVVVARIGTAEELTVREAGGPVTALAWSADGRHLAIGDALGGAAIVTFPNEIFK